MGKERFVETVKGGVESTAEFIFKTNPKEIGLGLAGLSEAMAASVIGSSVVGGNVNVIEMIISSVVLGIDAGTAIILLKSKNPRDDNLQSNPAR